MNRKAFFLVVTTTVLFGCATFAREETVGQQFRKVMADIDAQCKKDKLGPYLDPSDPEYRTKRNQTDCDILNLKPYDPLATPEGRFAHSLKLPPPHDKPKDVYKTGMTGEEYFRALCEAEAGEWVFRRVENVEGVFQARPPQPSPASYYSLVFYAVEKGEMNISNPQDSLVQPYQGRFEYLEVPSVDARKKDEKTYIRYVRDHKTSQEKSFQTVKDGAFVRIPYIVREERVQQLKSKFGYTWRGIRRLNDVENGIEGSELIIFDVASDETLAFRRLFTQHYPNPDYRDPRFPAARSCPKHFSDPAHRFIQNVLTPVNKE